MTGSNIFILFLFSVFGFVSYFGKNYFFIGSSFVTGLFEAPFITGVLGPLESDELGRVFSPLLLSIGLFSAKTTPSLVFRLALLAKRLNKLIL
jgi:hypothetical protein